MNAFDNTLILFMSDNGASAERVLRGDGHDPAAPPGRQRGPVFVVEAEEHLVEEVIAVEVRLHPV